MSTWGNGYTVGVTKPTSSNTGVGVLAPVPTTIHTGDITINTAGYVLKNTQVKGKVVINANNVTVQNCSIIRSNKLTGAEGNIIVNAGKTGALIQYNSIAGTAQGIYYKGIQMYGSGTIQYNSIYNVVDGIDVYPGSKSLIYANWIDGLQLVSPDPAHADNQSHCDGIQFEGGTNCIVKGNTITGMASTKYSTPSLLVGHPQALSALQFTPDAGKTITGFSVTNNWLGGGDMCINAGGTGNTTTQGSITNNIFTANQYDVGWFIDLYSGGTKISCSGNKTTTGAAVSPKKG